ncbi:M15 family metallopeptidase [Methylobacterium gnaphalii]|nr:M15 family metallopeptidase [Methylobacterium gnaphalii]
MNRWLTLFAALCAGWSSARAGSPFVDAASIVPGLSVEMRYAGSHNFVGRPIAGYEAPRCLLTRQAARALARAQADLARRGYGLKVFDCYRPTRAVADFMAWAADPAETRMKAEFYPRIDKRDLFRLGYIATHSAHSRGSTVDLTLMRLNRGEVDMGTPFDWFGPESAPGWRRLDPAQLVARGTLRAAMIRAGFRPYAQEWWHFTLAGEPHPTTAFDQLVR